MRGVFEMNERTDLTDAQWDALRKAWGILCEHFDHCIVAYETEAADETNEIVNVFECNYHGGYSTGIGLAERAKHQWLKRKDDDDPKYNWSQDNTKE